MSFFGNIANTLKRQNVLTGLIIANVAIFVAINIGINIFRVDADTFLDILAMPTNASEFLHRFWTPLTYMFTHLTFGHIFYNLLLLYFSGKIFAEFVGEKKLLYLYIMSGLSGGALLLILSLVAPGVFGNGMLIGASASTLGVITALALYIPNMQIRVFFLFEIAYKYLAIFLFIITTLLDFAINTGGKISHIGGAAFGLIYAYNLRRGRDFSTQSLVPKKKSPLKVVHKRPQTDEAFNHARVEDQKVIDDLLDKISKNGYDSLSKKEKELLFKLSQKK